MDINITLVGQMITFAIFVIFTMKFVWPPLKKAMDERKEKIQKGLSLFDNATKELANAHIKSNDLIKEAKYQAKKILDMANKSSMKIYEEAKQIAKQDAENIYKKAHNDAEVYINTMKQLLRKEIISIAILSAEKILKSNIDITSNSKLLKEISEDI